MLDVMSSESKVSKNGQVSLPAELRRRWNVDSVLFLDRGDHALVIPYPEDAVRSLRGRFKGPPGGPTSDEARAMFRAEEMAAEERRNRAAGWTDPDDDGDGDESNR